MTFMTKKNKHFFYENGLKRSLSLLKFYVVEYVHYKKLLSKIKILVSAAKLLMNS